MAHSRCYNAAAQFGQTLVRSHMEKWGYDLVEHEGLSFPAWAVLLPDTYVITVDEAKAIVSACDKFEVSAHIVREEFGFRVIFS